MINRLLSIYSQYFHYNTKRPCKQGLLEKLMCIFKYNIAKLVELRQKKGMTEEQARELLLNNYLYYGVMMVLYYLIHICMLCTSLCGV